MLLDRAMREREAQEVFVKLHRYGVSFENDAALARWLYRVTVNLCINRVRAARYTLAAAIAVKCRQTPSQEIRAL
jgi:DNA-directed RNA polymerase specialized sigma24 family protein